MYAIRSYYAIRLAFRRPGLQRDSRAGGIGNQRHLTAEWPFLRRHVDAAAQRLHARGDGCGVLDADTLRSINARLTNEVESLGAELRQVAGHDDLNLNSPTQLRALLFRNNFV